MYPIDSEMSLFRAITSDEEAATALILALKQRQYDGAAKLNPWDHTDKAAVSAVQMDVQWVITLDEAGVVRTAAQSVIGLGYMMEADVREDIAAGRLVSALGAEHHSHRRSRSITRAGRIHPQPSAPFVHAAREFASASG